MRSWTLLSVASSATLEAAATVDLCCKGCGHPGREVLCTRCGLPCFCTQRCSIHRSAEHLLHCWEPPSALRGLVIHLYPDMASEPPPLLDRASRQQVSTVSVSFLRNGTDAETEVEVEVDDSGSLEGLFLYPKPGSGSRSLRKALLRLTDGTGRLELSAALFYQLVHVAESPALLGRREFTLSIGSLFLWLSCEGRLRRLMPPRPQIRMLLQQLGHLHEIEQMVLAPVGIAPQVLLPPDARLLCLDDDGPSLLTLPELSRRAYRRCLQLAEQGIDLSASGGPLNCSVKGWEIMYEEATTRCGAAAAGGEAHLRQVRYRFLRALLHQVECEGEAGCWWLAGPQRALREEGISVDDRGLLEISEMTTRFLQQFQVPTLAPGGK